MTFKKKKLEDFQNQEIKKSKKRPISLVNLDTRILTGLATAESCTVYYSPSQSGFIKNRQAEDNLCLLIVRLNIIQDILVVATLISSDAKKALDMVQNNFLKQIICMYGFLCSFIKWIAICYLQPVAR